MKLSPLACYVTLDEFKTREEITNIASDIRVMKKIRAATAQIARWTGQDFWPLLETRPFDWESSSYLSFDNNVLSSINSLVDGASVSINPTGFIMLGADLSSSSDVGPWFGVEIDPTIGYMVYITTPRKAIKVNGVWGWHDNYSMAWHDSGLTLNGSLDAVQTTITLSADPTAATDTWGNSPAISAGQLIAVDSGANLEWMVVVKTTAGSNQITVVRDQQMNPAPSVSHVTGLKVNVFEVMQDIREHCLELASYYYDLDSADFGQTTIDAMGGRTIANDIPKNIQAKLTSMMGTRVR